MCEPTTIALIATAAAGTMSAVGQYQQGQAAEQVARNNQQMAEYAAEDAQRRGEKEVQETQRRAAQLRGTQRSMMAARGLDLSVGTPADILDQTEFFAAQDVATSRTNARREAWAVRADAANQGAAARAEASRLRMGSYGSLLGTATSVADKWDRYTRRPMAAQPGGFDRYGGLYGTAAGGLL